MSGVNSPADFKLIQSKSAVERNDYSAFEIGGYCVDIAARKISNETCSTRISPRATGVLKMLVEADGSVVSRPQLLASVWPEVTVGDDSLTQAVAELRRAFGERRGEARIIETVQKCGYRLTAPVIAHSRHAPVDASQDLYSLTESKLPLEAYLAVLEARELERLYGYQAADAIKVLMDGAAASAPHSACVQAEYAILVGCTILHRGDRVERLEAAMAAAERALALRPDFLKALRAHGFVAGGLGRLEACKRSFEAVFARDPGDAESHLLAAQAFFGLGATQTALVLAERATALNADDLLPPYIAARGALALGDPVRAAKAARICLARAEMMLAINPELTRAASFRGCALAMLGQKEAALTALAGSATGEPHFCRAVAYADAGDTSAALDVIEQHTDAGWQGAGWLLMDPAFGTLASERRYRTSARWFAAAEAQWRPSVRAALP